MEHVPKRTRERQADLNLEDSVRTESMSDMGYRPGGAYDLRNSDNTHILLLLLLLLLLRGAHNFGYHSLLRAR